MYDYPEHYTENVFSAIKLVEKLKDKGEYDFFRGQPHTFDIQPSLFRKDVNIKEAVDKLDRFANWVHNTPELISLHNNQNAMLAVAQHYGLKTNMLDFTSSPLVAGFFATDGSKKGNTGTIICLNKKRFEESWRDINERHFKNEGAYLTEIVEIDVKNLWRLQAQQGIFLKCNVDPHLLEMFSCFLHIYFPANEGTEVLKSELIYPNEKSHLEMLLDRYLLIESYPEREKELTEIFSHKIGGFSEDDITEEIKSHFINNELPLIHESWNFDPTNPWLFEPDERYLPKNSDIEIEIVIPATNSIIEFESNIKNQIKSVFDINSAYRKNVSWQIKSEEGLTLYIESDRSMEIKVTEFTEFPVARMVDSIYSGMRNLPYTEENIIKAISRYLTLLKFGVYEVMDDVIGIELSGGEVRGRGFCNYKRIKEALRDDFFSLIKPENLNSDGELDIRDILFTARYVKHSYNFDKFIDLFVEAIIPTQAAVAIEGLILILNPMRIDVLGES